jgi:hypothetical protein
VQDDPDLPGAVNAVLRARSKAFAAGNKGKADLRELREEISKLGHVVRDQNKNQYWRAIQRPQEIARMPASGEDMPSDW